MESGNGGAPSKGVLIPASERTGIFQSSILTTLKSAYLYEESKQSFRYTSAVLVENPTLEEKYNAFRKKRKEVGYSEEELKESYGFLLFDDIHKANALGQTGVLTGNSTCTTLGDPSKGVYISMYSDCLDLNCWYHEKSGYIAIIRLTKGRVKKVLENYTQNYNAPTVGFDCHVSEQLPSVSSETSSFLAFERTQYYVYELLDDAHIVTAQSPSAAFPIAIVSFLYTDTKATLEAPLKKCEEKKLVYQYFPWRGQLQISTQVYDVGLRSTAGALIPALLSPVVKIDRAISMFNLRQLLPRAVFETCFSGEVCLDGLYFSQCEFVSTEVEESYSLSLLLREIKEKDLALIIQLNDGGFLILLHSSHFVQYDDIASSGTDVLQGMFVFPNTRGIHTDANFQERKLATSSEILQVLPVLSYAESKVEKTPIDPSEELCEVFTQHMQTYAALINPGLASSPSREISIFPDQYDVPAAHKHLYSSPEWTNKEWESVGSYLRKPDSFQLQVSKATEILMSGQEQRMEDLDDDVYIYLSSPEGPQTQPDSIESEDWLEQSPANVETPVDSCITSSESKVNSTTVPQNVLLDDVKAGDDTGISDPSVPIETDDLKIKNLLTPSTSDDLPAELIVSLTSAENAVTGEGLTMISNVSAAKHNDFQLSVFSTAKLQTEGVNSLNEEGIATKQVLDCPPVTNLTKTKRRKLHRGHYKRRQKLSKACFETPSSQMQAADDNWSPKKYRAKKSLGRSSLSLSKIDQRKVQMRKCKSSQLSSKNESLSSASAGLAVPDEQNPWTAELERTIFMDFEDFPLRKKTERSDLKPVISECGRILVPHGSVDFGEQIKSLTVKLQSRKDEQCPEKTSANAPDTMVQESSAAPETAVGEAEATSQDGGNQLHVVHDRPPDDGNGSLMLNPESGELYLKTDVTATPPSETVKGILSQGNLPKNSEFLFSKLKSVLERKRKTDLPSSDETTADTAPCLKKVKVDSHAGILKSSYANSCVQDTSLCVKEVSKMSSVDPIFAFALGLTPKWTVDKIQKPEGQETQQKETISDKPPQILNRPSPIFPRGGRIKTLKRHQGISTESVKKKWWLHFQTPACYASEKLKDSGRANSVRKTVKENINSACSSTDALSLLADLALRAGNDQVLPQPDPALERETETSLKKCDLSKDLTCAEQESVLPSLLTQPAAKPMQPLQSTSPNHLVESSEWVGLVSKEHAYSSPPSSSLLLGLPGTPFQVSPLSGSSRLLRHHQTMYGNGIKILHPSVVHERSSEENQTIPGFLKKNIVRRRKFRHSRTFENKDGSIQVTKQWEETYDFNLDSKFTNDSKDRTIVRALHGPWDFSLQDTSEEVLLIVHMWIGLFYSRSTARFFHVGSCQHSEERDPLEMSRQTGSVSLLAPFSSIPDTDSMLDPGSAILDLSPRNSNAEKVSPDPQANRKETVPIDPKEANETLNALELPVGPQESITKQQSKKMVLSTEINEVNDVRSSKENTRTCTELQNALSLENANVQPWKGDGTIVSVGEEMETVYVEPENNQKASGVSDVLNGCNIEQTDTKDGIENSEATETSLVQTHGRDSSISLTDEEVDSNIELCDVLQTVEDDDTQPKDGENWESKENLYKEDHVETPRVICTNDHPTDKEFGIVCVGNVLDKKHLPTEEPKASSPGKPVNEGFDCCTVQESKEMEDEDQIGKEDGLDDKTEKEPFPHWTNVPLCETKVQLTDEKDFKQIGNTDEALAKSHSKIVIPFIGIDTSGEDSVQFHDPHSQGKVEVVQAKEEIPFISETVLNSGVCGTPQKDIRKAQLSVGKLSLSLNDVSNTNHLGSGSISRCSTPTMDEKPFEYLTRSGPSNTSAAFSGSKTKSMTQKPFSGGATAAKNEMPPRCTVNCFASPHHNIPPDIELRTIKVLQSLDKLLQKSSETSSRIEKADKRTLHEAANPRSKNITTCFAPSHTSYDFKDEKIGNTVPAVVSASSSRELNTESTGHFPISPLFKLEELLGAKLQLQQIAASVPHSCSESDKMHETTQEQVSCQPYRSVPSPESLPASIVNQETHKTTSQTNSSNEPRLCSQRPVMAVKPSKSDESQGDNISKGRQIEKAVVSYFSKDLQNTNPKVTYTVPTTSLLVKSAERVKQTSEGVNDVKPDACELSSKSSWLTNFSVSSPLPVWCFTSAKGSSNLDDASVKEVGQLTETSIQIKRKDHSFASTSHADKNPLLGPQSSLICTVNNPTRNQSSNLLEQVSQRCVQNDPTEASMEQECLIFSETMKQLMKRSKRGPVSQRDMHDKRNFTCASPLTVHFNCLDVQGDSEDNLNTLLNTTPLVGQKIKVEMPERKNLAHFKEEQNTLQVYNISQGAGNLMEHPGIAGVTSECSRLYKAMMNDVCAVRKVPSRPKHFTMDRGYPTTEPGNHFDFCDQMKKELDESFRSNLNSVVKKSCKTKYRFYILVTSDVAFFQETKAQLEAEGHTAVQPSQFFLCEDGSSSLLIIIRNEDIAEHILEVPHLLRLKTSPGVQFAGIDEPDDVVNLTHQELFKRGGFVMFDSAALELLSLCNMKKMSELLQELSRTGKWKWMMHYRDSRRLKENARISKEAKEKKLFLNVCQEGGILEVLPYHECDLMSRDLPDYRTCLVRLQVQNISARYPVFITDKATESAFGENGILTMTFQSFLAYSQSKTFAG
uniref:uncharacterized protein tasor2 isoform X4 n=1 Tax=Gasterosteus aculeatus aculeatus TaxID=481459 RepID=UPI001A98B58D|nr:uncharacterized protein tasor2 isoform X4 [Gasterosteus aculeatus aculeatus]